MRANSFDPTKDGWQREGGKERKREGKTVFECTERERERLNDYNSNELYGVVISLFLVKKENEVSICKRTHFENKLSLQ